MRKIRIEGYSTESMEGAVADAMSKAASYMSEERDVNIQLLEMAVLPGRGYKAVIEVTIVPMGESDRFKPKAADVELKDIKKREDKEQRQKEERHLKNMVTEHFSPLRDHLPDIPDYFQFNVTRARLLNYDIEQDFFHASHSIYPCKSWELPAADRDAPGLDQVLGKRPENDQDLEPQ